MALERMRIAKGPLLLECLKRPLTWVPLVASAAGLMLFPDHAATWLVAPALFAGGACHLIYDFFMGKAVRRTLEARRQALALAARHERMVELRGKLRADDRATLDAIAKLQEQLGEKIEENHEALEMTGTLPETYSKLVEQLVSAGLEALETKLRLQATAVDLYKLGAQTEANAIAERTQVLDGRLSEVKQRLSDALAQIALLDTGLGVQTLTGISETLAERLELARQVSAELAPQEEPELLARQEHEPDDPRKSGSRRRMRRS